MIDLSLKQRTVGIIGAKRSGKTYFTGKLSSRLIENGNRLIVFDTIGELGKLIKPKLKMYEIAPKEIEKQAVAFGLIVSNYNGKKAVGVNLVNLTRDEIVDFTDVTLTTIGKIKNTYWVFDEVAEYLNQFYRQSKELERLIRHGGNWDNTFIFNTQRPAYLNKNTFNLIDILISFRLNWSRDLTVLKELLSNTGKNDSDIKKEVKEITQQKVGEYKAYKLYLS